MLAEQVYSLDVLTQAGIDNMTDHPEEQGGFWHCCKAEVGSSTLNLLATDKERPQHAMVSAAATRSFSESGESSTMKPEWLVVG